MVYKFIWRTALRFAYRLARVWWRVRRKPHEGALVVIRVGAAIVLVRASYRRRWNFPGGGIKSGETPEDAARREVMEELGLDLPKLEKSAVISGTWDGRPDRVHFFELRLDALPPLNVDNIEIVEAQLVPEGDAQEKPLTGPVAAYLNRAHLAVGKTVNDMP
jgi:8-oxo-dGTP pyrophosphatase MutT (NUDIX family)